MKLYAVCWSCCCRSVIAVQIQSIYRIKKKTRFWSAFVCVTYRYTYTLWLCEQKKFSWLRLSIVQVFGAEENDNAIFFLKTVPTKVYPRLSGQRMIRMTSILSNGKILCDMNENAVCEFTDDTKLHFMSCLGMTSNPATTKRPTDQPTELSAERQRKKSCIKTKFIKYEHKSRTQSYWYEPICLDTVFNDSC